MTGTSGCRTSASPTSPPPPWTMLTTPAGTPASISSSTKRSPSAGVSVAGLKTTVFPQTSAGSDLPGRDRDREVPRRDHADDADRLAHAHVELVAELGRRRLAEQAPALAAHVVGHVDRFLDVAAAPRAAPCPSRGPSAAASSSLCSARSCAKRKRISPRFGAGTRRQSSYASFAAATARSTSSAPSAGRCRSPRRSRGSRSRRSRRRRRRPTRRRCSSGMSSRPDGHGGDSIRRFPPSRGTCPGSAGGAGRVSRACRRSRRALRRSGPSRRSRMTVTFGLSL